MKNLKYLLFLISVLFAFTSCKKNDNSDDTKTTDDSTTSFQRVEKPTSLTTLSDLNSVILYSLDNTYLVKTTTQVSDGSVVVYQIDKSVTIDDTLAKSGSFVTTTKMLDETFALVTKSTDVKKFTNLDINSLFTCDLNESYLSNVSISLTNVSYSVKKDSSTHYFKSEDAKSDNDVSVTMNVNDFKITSITYSYTLDSKTISSTTTYSYLA